MHYVKFLSSNRCVFTRSHLQWQVNESLRNSVFSFLKKEKKGLLLSYEFVSLKRLLDRCLKVKF